MPFTLAHPAVVWPLRRLGLPVGVMVVAAMVPDVPLFAPWPVSYSFTHRLLGVVTADLVTSLAVFLVWIGLVRDALVDVCPAAVRERLAAHAPYDRRQWAWAPVAAIVGSPSHVAWDAFTHQGRWGVRRITWLQTSHAGLVGYEWAQYASGVVGCTLVVVWACAWLRRQPRRPRQPCVPELGPRALAAAAVATGVCGAAAVASRAADGLHAMAYRGAVFGVVAAGLCVVAVATVWRLMVGDRAPG